jgi:membrane-bound serine protease (ClpP class)
MRRPRTATTRRHAVFSAVVLATLVATATIVAPAPPASAAATRGGQIEVVKISGLVDALNADLLRHALGRAAATHAEVVVVQLNSTGGVLGAAASAALGADVRTSTVPVAVWVGGSGRPRAVGQAFDLLRQAAFSGVGPGARVGPQGRTESGAQAVASGVVATSAPTLGDFIIDLDGRRLGSGPPLALAAVVRVAGQPRRELRPGVDVAFLQLSVLPKVLHGVASPNVAFVALLSAVALAMFEFFTAGVGVAAATAALIGAVAGYGLGALPTRPGAVALLLFAMFGFAVDVQSGAPRAWTVIGGAAGVAGSLLLYRGQTVSWWVLVVMGILVLLFMLGGMPAMIRTRFSTPTIGRQSMVGAMGVALTGVDPDGTVTVHGAPWAARTHRATPIAAGHPVRVTGIEGLVLQVEPESGGARPARH